MKRLLFCILLLSAANAGAHDLWLERDGSGVTLRYGHAHGSHEGPTLLEYSPGILVRADCYGIDGVRSTPAVSDAYPVHITDACGMSCVLVSTGYWTKTPYGTRNVGKNQVEYAVKSWLSYESVKRIDGWSDVFAEPLVRELDIVPLENPLAVKPGKKLRLLVTFDGQPVPGAVVTYNGSPRGVTGKDGRINIRIREGGFQVIQAGHSLPLKSDKANEIVYTANLNFELQKDS